MTTTARRIRLGIAGLGRAFTLMLPTFRADPRIELVAAADPREEARGRFATDFGAKVYADVAELRADSSVEVVYLATPHELHAEHAVRLAAAGKHLLIEKPLAISVEECLEIIAAVERAGVQLVVGHSHGFDAPIRYTRELIASGRFGRVRMIAALNYTDFLYRPRRAEELDTRRGGGVLYSQGAHQVDVVRVLATSPARTVRAALGAWDPARPTEGAYAGLVTFEDGGYASLSYSGYAHFDSDELCGWIGELGERKDPRAFGAARRKLADAPDATAEAALKAARAYGGAAYAAESAPGAKLAHEHFGFIVVSCEGADLRPVPSGVMVYADDEAHLETLAAPRVPRAAVIDELYAAVVDGTAPMHDGRWGLATIEIVGAMLRSGRMDGDVALVHQRRSI
jgi:phthalate 4,5-cis-dihydrodiol dehydrogenase